MKKITYLLIAIFLFGAVYTPAFSKVNNKLTIEVIGQKEINGKCAEYGEEINGCFFKKGVNDIYISDDLSKYAFRRVVMHEMGHYLLEDAPMDLFRGFKDYKGDRHSSKERAADRFAAYILSADLEENITKEERDLFKEALSGKYLRK